MGRLHSVTSGSFREARIQGPLSGDEIGKRSVISRPEAVLKIARIRVTERLLGGNPSSRGATARAPVTAHRTSFQPAYTLPTPPLQARSDDEMADRQ
jgi:hypothetical protein